MTPSRLILIAGAASVHMAAVPLHANPKITVELPGGAMMEFVWIEPGTLVMGRNLKLEEGQYNYAECT